MPRRSSAEAGTVPHWDQYSSPRGEARGYRQALKSKSRASRAFCVCEYYAYMIKDIYPVGWPETRGIYSPAKKIDLGNAYLIYVSGQQVDKKENNEAVTDDIEEQTELVF